MAIIYLEGDLLQKQKEYNIDIICHQVNCQGKMGSGIAKKIRDTYPHIYETYRQKCLEIDKPNLLLGEIQCISIDKDNSCKCMQHPQVCNMFAQDTYGYDNKRYTSYDAFYECLNKLKILGENWRLSLGFPYNIGCCRGGADWRIIENMIKTVLKNCNVYIIKYNKEGC